MTAGVDVRRMRAEDIPGIIALCRRVYPHSAPWTPEQLESHLRVFPEGQLVAVDPVSGAVVGMAASLIVYWDDYDVSASWRDFTEHGMFTNHDPERGRTLYGAEVMVDPDQRGRGIGSALYGERRRLTVRLGLLRIRAGARLRGYGRHAPSLSPEAYVRQVESGELYDPTLSFQLEHGFSALAVVRNYLQNDPESLGWAVVIEWLNPKASPAAERIPLR